jgi:hypothetical protein
LKQRRVITAPYAIDRNWHDHNTDAIGNGAWRMMTAFGFIYFVVARTRKSTNALRSSTALMVCSGILVPGV